MSNMPAPERRSGSTHAWRLLRARKIRQAIRHSPDGALYCEVCGKGPLDPDARPGSAYAVDVDHVVPIAEGGVALPPLEGLRILCPRDNRSAGGKLSSGQFGRRGKTAAPSDVDRFRHTREW
jgi:5-methylcytosine-specific restriction endonuclease McrA